MQNIDFKTQNPSIQLCPVKVLLEPITLSIWYEMKREVVVYNWKLLRTKSIKQNTLPSLYETNQTSCVFCLEPFDSTSTYARCLDCPAGEVLICFECLRMGAESHPHKRNHRYTLHDNIGPNFFNDDQTWGAQEDLQLLNSLIRAHLDQWPEMSKDFGRKKSLTEALERLDKCFLRSEIGRYILKNFARGSVRTWESVQMADELEESSIPSTSSGICGNGSVPDFRRLNGNSVIVDTPKLSSLSSSCRRRTALDEEDSSDDEDDVFKQESVELAEIGERRMSTRSVGELSNPNDSRRATRKEQLLAAAKNVAAEAAFRGNRRKSSLELSEAINLDSPIVKKNKKNVSTEWLDDDKLAMLYALTSANPHFYNTRVTPMDAQQVAKFDEEDLQMLTYLPFREEFENEYKNEAEQLITRIVFPREGIELSEVDKFLNEVRYARFNRYNRLMRIRAAKRATILEHNMLSEYLSIVKTNISERGKYSVFEGRYFNTKSKEDFFRPVFTQLRQVADRETLNQLAKDIGAMETLKDQIDELRQLHQKGVTELKGRLKVDATPPTWSRKRKTKKVESAEQRKAGLRWKRIKRWNKKTVHLQQLSETED